MQNQYIGKSLKLLFQRLKVGFVYSFFQQILKDEYSLTTYSVCEQNR